MDTNQKQVAVANYIMQLTGQADPKEQQPEIEKLAADCPDAVATELGLTTVIDKAYEAMMIAKGTPTPLTGGQQSIMNPPTAGSQLTGNSTSAANKKKDAVVPTISTADAAAIADKLLQDETKKLAVTQATTITKIILAKPDGNAIIPAGTKGTIKKESWKNIQDKIAAGSKPGAKEGWVVLPDDGTDIAEDKRIASKTNYEALKKAAEAPAGPDQQVEIYRAALARAAKGYIVKKGTDPSGKEVQMTKEEMKNFVLMETSGYVLASDTTMPAVRLRQLKAKNDSTDIGRIKLSKVILADLNGKQAIENGHYDIAQEVTQTKHNATVKSDLCFRVKDLGAPIKNGSDFKKRTVRVSLSAEVFSLELKPEYTDTFAGIIGGQDKDYTAPPNKVEMDKIRESQMAGIALLREKARNPLEMHKVADYKDALKEFDAPADQAPAGVEV